MEERVVVRHRGKLIKCSATSAQGALGSRTLGLQGGTGAQPQEVVDGAFSIGLGQCFGVWMQATITHYSAVNGPCTGHTCMPRPQQGIAEVGINEEA